MAAENPKISVIIPTLNQGNFIEQTILSIVGQSYTNFEIIVIDGGSSDNTLDTLRRYAGQISYQVSETDSGQSNAINKGLKIASGDIVTWLNSDDYFEAAALEAVVKSFKLNPGTDIIHGKARLFGEKVKSKIIGPAEDLLLHEYLPYMRFPQPSSFFRKKFLNQDFAVNETLHYAMDFELVARAILSGARVKRIDKLLSHYRLHPGSKSNDEIKFLYEWTEVLHRIFISQKNGGAFAEKLRALSLVKTIPKEKFYTTVAFTEEELESVFLEHLHLHYHCNYRLFNSAQCLLVSSFLKENYKSFYLKNYYNNYNIRLKFIPRFVFDLIRNPGK